MIGKWTLLDLRWLGLGGQTVKNLRANLISTKAKVQVIPSQQKCMQTLAKRSRKLAHVFNFRQLASPFGRAFNLYLEEAN